MPLFHCFYVSVDNKVMEAGSIRSASAASAVEQAALPARHNSVIAGIEIWRNGRLDHKVWLSRDRVADDGARNDAAPESGQRFLQVGE